MNLNSESSMFDWWLQGLKILIPSPVKSLFNPTKKRILIQIQQDQLAVLWPSQKNNESTHYQLDHDTDLQAFNRQLAKLSKEKHNLVLCIPANKGLKSMINLPLSAEPDLANILEFEIDRRTPFTRDQVYSGHRVIEKNKANNTLNVELNVIPKKQLDPQLSTLIKYGIRPQVAELLNNEDTAGINVLSGSTSNDEHKTTKRINQLLIIVSLALLAVALVIPFKNLDNALKKTERDIEQARAGAMEVNALRTKWEKAQENQKRVNEKVDRHSSVTVMLDELTRLLPDDTWLTRVHKKDAVIRLQGESSSATALISIIENSEHFSNTRFQSPVTSNVSTGNDRFQITTKEVEQ